MVARAGTVRGLEQLEKVRLCSVSKRSQGSVSIWSFHTGRRELAHSVAASFQEGAFREYQPVLSALMTYLRSAPVSLLP